MTRPGIRSRSRARKIARIDESCTGCGGSPVCTVFCRQGALELVEDPDHYPFRRMQVNPDRCSGCGNCIARGKAGIRLLGCPWDAITMMTQ